MKRGLVLALIVPGFAVIFVLAIGAGYFIGQTPFRTAPAPPGTLSMPAVSAPAANAPSGSAPAAPETQPGASGPAEQPGGGEAPSGSPPSGAVAQPGPGPAAGGAPAPAATPPSPAAAPVQTGPTDAPAIPAPPSRFHVQAGAFDDRNSAGLLVMQLRSRGYAVTLVEGPPYRVWVGGYLDRATAERLAANLQQAGFEASLTPR